MRWRWTWSALIWLIGALLWSLAAIEAGATPSDAIRLGGLQMAAVALLAPGIWRLTAGTRRVWHIPALLLFVTVYTAMQGFVWMRDRPIPDSFAAALTGPVAAWNFLIGSFIYVAIASASYARRAEHARQEARVAARDAQLAALSAQLQPHFLFNALHTVGALVRTDPERADRALDELGQLLRYALQESGEDVTLAREWDFAKDYLAFEDLRLGRRLRLDVRIDDHAMGTRVPPFLLQPLLENAVRHGVAGSPAGGDVRVHIARDGDTVRITVHNSVPETGVTAGMAGTGLRRLRERLELTYGAGRATVQATATPGAFEVRVTVPA